MDRRQALALLVAAHAAPAAAAVAPAPQTFVLVHGAWHGGWCWREVRAILEAAGHRVFTPTLTGLGERSHLREPIPSLQTHVADVCAILEAEELRDVVLVGHSYGGMVVTGVADAAKTRLNRVIYLDAAVPSHGQTMVTQRLWLTAEGTRNAEAQVRMLAVDGWMPAFPPTIFGVPEGPAADWLRRRLTPHPLRTWLDPLALPNGGAEGLPRTFVLCTDPLLQQTGFAERAAVLRTRADWRVRELATGHDAMVTAPAATAALLLEP